MATTTVEASGQPKFGWDPEIPAGPFFADLPKYEIAGTFTFCYTPEELGKLDLDSKANLSVDDKTRLLLGLLQDKLLEKEDAAGLSGLRSTNWKEWHRLYSSICGMEQALGMPEAEDKLRFIISHPESGGEPDVGTKMWLMSYLIDAGKLDEAETLSPGLLEALEAHPKLGRASPQAMGQSRNLIKLKWKQGNVAEAKALIADAWKRIDEMAATQFAKYVQEETDELNDVVKKLEANQ